MEFDSFKKLKRAYLRYRRARQSIEPVERPEIPDREYPTCFQFWERDEYVRVIMHWAFGEVHDNNKPGYQVGVDTLQGYALVIFDKSREEVQMIHPVHIQRVS